MDESASNIDQTQNSCQWIQQLREDNERLVKRVEANRAVQNCLEDENQSLRSDKMRLEEENQSLQAENARLNASLTELQQTMDEQISALTSRAETTEKMNSTLTQRFSVLRQKFNQFLNNQKDVVLSLFDNFPNQSDEVARKRPRLDESADTSNSDQSNELQQKLDKANEEINSLQSQLSESNQKVSSLREELYTTQVSKEDVDKKLIKADQRVYKLKDQRRGFKEIFNTFDPSRTFRNEVFYVLRDQAKENFKTKRYRDALDDYLKLFLLEKYGRNDPNQLAHCWYNIAKCQHSSIFYGPYTVAKSIKKAIKYLPNNAVQNQDFNDLDKALDVLEKALDELRRALKLDSNDSESHTSGSYILYPVKSYDSD